MSLFNIRHRDTSPVHTGLNDPVIAGANLVQNSDFPTKIHEDLIVVPSLLKLARYVMTKSPKGIVSLHFMVPYQRVGVRFQDNQARLQPTTIFVMLNCNKNEFNTKETGVHVISDSTLAMAELSYNSEGTYNGVSVNGSPTVNYIPANFTSWTKPYKDSEVGAFINQQVLDIFFELKELAKEIGDEEDIDVLPEETRALMEEKWNEYLTAEQNLVKKGYLVESNLIYADASGLRPITSCFQNTKSRTNRYLDASKVYGTIDSGASFAPDTSMVYSVGTITPTHEEPISGYQYGIYAIGSKKDDVQVVSEDQKATTLETCTREILVYDASGRSCPLQVTVNDIMRSSKPVKRAQNLASLAVGTSIMVTGKLAIRVKQQGSLAVSFRISDPTWTTTGRSNANEVNASMVTELDTSTFSVDELDSLVETSVSTEAKQTDAEIEADMQEAFVQANIATREESQDSSGKHAPLDNF